MSFGRKPSATCGGTFDFNIKGCPSSGIVFIGEELIEHLPEISRASKLTLLSYCAINVAPNSTSSIVSKDYSKKTLRKLQKLLTILRPSLVVLLGRISHDIVAGYMPNIPRLNFRGVPVCFGVHPKALEYRMLDRFNEWKTFWDSLRPLLDVCAGKRRDVKWKLPLHRRK